MASRFPTILLNDGLKIPSLSFGTGTAWYAGKNDGPLNQALVESVRSALSLGYRHLDAAEIYGTEREVGQAIKDAGLPRESLFVTSKIYSSLPDVEGGIRNSLQRLGLEYLDLFLIHSPFKFTNESELQDSWRAMEGLVDKGLTRSIGVSNYRVSDLKTILSIARIKPAVNQIEFHPYLQSPQLVEFCAENGIAIAAYSPLSPVTSAPGGPVDEVLQRISSANGVSPAVILLRWSLQKGCIVVTTSGKSERMAEYLQALQGELTGEEVKLISDAGAKKHFRRFWGEQFGDGSSKI